MNVDGKIQIVILIPWFKFNAASGGWSLSNFAMVIACMTMTAMQIAETSIPTSARLEQGQINIMERYRLTAVFVWADVVSRWVSSGVYLFS